MYRTDGMSIGTPGLHLWLVSRVGHYQLRRIADGGLPPALVRPFRSLLTRCVDREDWEVFSKIEEIRAELATRAAETVTIFSDPRPLASLAHAPGPRAGPIIRTLREVAQVSSVHPQWGLFLRHIAQALQARSILELGASAGLSGCYLASSRHCERFITVDGCEALCRLAAAHLRRVAKHFEIVHASFEEALDKILPALEAPIDLVYIDGGKDKQANIRYFDRLMPHVRPGGVMVLDDIHWSSAMWAAWDTISRRDGFSVTINAGRFGVCVRETQADPPARYTLYRLAGVDLYEVMLRCERVKAWSARSVRQRFPNV